MRNFSNVRRVVIKIGTNTLTRGKQIDTAYVRDLARQVHSLYSAGRQVVIVTSGAIGMGAGQLHLKKMVKKEKMQQACAAIGQPLLMHEYHTAFSKYNISVAQVLLTTDVLNHRTTYVNLRNSIETLLYLGVIPVLNENDSISTEEIGTAFGDNDRLSALI
jgi:glutamate 5-kinase